MLSVRKDPERLRRHPDVAREVLALQALQPRHLATQALVLGVESPEEARDPRRSTFDEHDSQPWIFLEDAVRDEADEVGLDRLRPEHVGLEIRAYAAASGARRVGLASSPAVYGHRAPGFLRSRVDGLTHRLAKTAIERVVDQHDLYHPRVLRMATDLSLGHIGQLAADHDRRPEARVL